LPIFSSDSCPTSPRYIHSTRPLPHNALTWTAPILNERYAVNFNYHRCMTTDDARQIIVEGTNRWRKSWTEATRALVRMLRGWSVCLDANLAPSDRTRHYLLRLASSSGLMKLN
jgi:hypothetical protein